MPIPRTMRDLSFLVVEDFDTMRRIECNLLKECGIKKIDEARDGSEALEMVKNNPGKHDFIMTDTDMPTMNGFEFLQQLRKSGNTTPTMMVLAPGRTYDVRLSQQVGADGHIVKPFTQADLQERLSHICLRRGIPLSIGELSQAPAQKFNATNMHFAHYVKPDGSTICVAAAPASLVSAAGIQTISEKLPRAFEQFTYKQPRTGIIEDMYAATFRVPAGQAVPAAFGHRIKTPQNS